MRFHVKTFRSAPVFAALSLIGLVQPAFADVTIDQIVPEDAVFVVSAPDISTTMERFEQTPLFDMFQHDDMARIWNDTAEDIGTEFTEWLTKIGMSEDDVNWPQHAAGLALFLAMNEDLGVNQPALMIYGDWGDHADKTSELIQAALDDGAKTGEIRYEESDLLGRTVITIDLQREDADPDEGEEFDHFGDMPMGGGPMDMFGDFEKVHIVREGSSFILCSNLDALADALERMEGRVGRRSLAENETYRGAVAQLGEHDVSAVVLMSNVGRLLSSDPDMMMINMMAPMLGAAVGNVQAMSMSYRVTDVAGDGMLPADRPMVETTLGVYMPNGKQGLTTLLDVRGARQAVPAFVSGQTTSYGVMHLQFDRIVDELTNIVRSNPMLAMEMDEYITEVGPVLEEIFATLGPRIHMFSTIEQPVRAGGTQSVWAIECRDTQRFENAIAAFAPQIGLEPRDFLGHRMYTTPPGFFDMMMPMGPAAEPVDEEPMSMSVGIGGGHVVVGVSKAVEDVMRLVGETGASAFADNDAFAGTTSSIPVDNLLAWGYSDLPMSMKQMFLDQEAQMEQYLKDMAEWNEDEAWLEEMRRDWEESMETSRVFSRLLPDYIGPMTYIWQSTDSGFVGRYNVHPPADRN